MTRILPVLLLMTACSSLELTQAQGQHVTAGMAVGGITYSVTRNPFHACMASTAAGVAKEVYDSTGRGHATVSDVLYTAVPSCVIYYVFDRFAAHGDD